MLFELGGVSGYGFRLESEVGPDCGFGVVSDWANRLLWAEAALVACLGFDLFSLLACLET